MSYHDPESYDLSKFVAWWLRENPQEDPKLPLEFEDAEQISIDTETDCVVK